MITLARRIFLVNLEARYLIAWSGEAAERPQKEPRREGRAGLRSVQPQPCGSVPAKACSSSHTRAAAMLKIIALGYCLAIRKIKKSTSPMELAVAQRIWGCGFEYRSCKTYREGSSAEFGG